MPYIINPWRYVSANGCPIPLNLLITNETVFTADLSWGVIKATGGSVSIVNDGGTFYAVHTFNSNGTFEVITDVDVEYLVVAGGGGGGSPSTNSGTGGGGAGGLLTNVGSSPLSLTADTYTITVGDGGLQNTNGGDSSLDTLFTATGGGRGGYGGTTLLRTGGNGASGGGGSGTFASGVFIGGTGIVGQGFDGGDSQNSSSSADVQVGGGGGGASEVGGDASGAPSTGIAGDGGDGLEININGTPTYYAGGGGGGKRTSTGGSAGIGGLGGGGNGGANAVNGGDGTPNTGGGGGGVGPSATSAGIGGSGVIIIKYQIDEPGDYEVEWFLSGSTISEGTDTVNNFTSYNITGLNYSTNYETRVRKVCSVGVYSDWSDKVGFTTEVFEAPTNLNSSLGFFDTTITWSGSGIESQWQVEWGLNGYVTPIDTVTANTETYFITGLTTGTTYEYKINGIAEGQLSVTASNTLTTLNPPLPPVTNLTGNTVNASSIGVNWNGNGYLGEEYNVEWGLSGYVTPISSTITSDEFYYIDGLTGGTTYEVRVKSLLGGLESTEESTFVTPIWKDYITLAPLPSGTIPDSLYLSDFENGDSVTFGNWPFDNDLITSGYGNFLPNGDIFIPQGNTNSYFASTNRWTILSIFGDIKSTFMSFTRNNGSQDSIDDNYDIYTIRNSNRSMYKFSSGGTQQWVTLLPYTYVGKNVTALSMDHSKIFYSVDGFMGTLNTSTGSIINTITGRTIESISMSVDSNDRVILSGDYNINSYPSVFIGPLEIWDFTTGTLIQTIESGNTTHCSAVDTDDNIIYSYYPGSGVTVDVVKVNSSGVEQWRRTIPISFTFNIPNQIRIGSDNSIAVLSTTNNRYYITKYDSSGTLLYHKDSLVANSSSILGGTTITPLPISRYF